MESAVAVCDGGCRIVLRGPAVTVVVDRAVIGHVAAITSMHSSSACQRSTAKINVSDMRCWPDAQRAHLIAALEAYCSAAKDSSDDHQSALLARHLLV